MAYSSKFLLGFLLAATTISMTVGQLPTQIPQVAVLGQLVCSPTGTVTPGVPSTPLAGVNVHVTCNNGTIDLGTLVTNTTGFFDGVLRTVDGVLLHPSTCVATVTLPIVECTAFPPTGVLHSVLRVVGGLVDTLLGSLLQMVAGTWNPAPV